MKRLLIAGLISLACSTSTALSAEPKPLGVDAKVIAAFRSSLKDPFSVREFQIGQPYRANSSAAYPGMWNVCVSLYAKNGFGGYGKGFYRVYFKNGQVMEVLGGTTVAIKPDCGPLREVKF